MGMYTFRGEMEPTCHTSHERPHHQAQPALQVRPAWQVRSALAGAGGPALCHVLGLEHFLHHVHNLDGQDLSRKRHFDRMGEVVITWINASTSPADQPPQPSFQEHLDHHQAKVVHPMS
jgi:hypothetical protein